MSAKLNKADKFVKKQFELGKTRNGVREAIFEKLGTWNFPPEYENALSTQDPNYGTDNEPILGVDYLDDFVCGECGNCHELCFCGEHDEDEDPCIFCGEWNCVCEDVNIEPVLDNLKKLPEPGTAEWEVAVDKMRADIVLMEQHAPMINAAHKIIENSIRCNDCDAVTRLDENATGYCETCGSANVRRRKFSEEFERFQKEKGGNSHV